MSMCLTNKFLPLLIPLTSSISYALCSNGYYICLRKEREKNASIFSNRIGEFPFAWELCSDRGVSGKEFTKSSDEEEARGAGG